MTTTDRLLRRLLQIGIADFLLISAFAIHRWRRDTWQAFEDGFQSDALAIFGQPAEPLWLYGIAFPFVTANFGAMVAMLRGARGKALPWFIGGAAGIAVMPLAGAQFAVVYRMIWPDILTMAGYAIGGAIAVIVGLGSEAGVDSADARARDDGNSKD